MRIAIVATVLLSASAAGAVPTPLDPLNFSHCPDYGGLAPVDPNLGTTTATAASPYDVVVSPSGQWVYVSYHGGIQIFEQLTSGALQPTTQTVQNAAALKVANRQLSGMTLANNGTLLLAAGHDSTGSQDSDLVVFDVSTPTSVPAPTLIATPAGSGSIEVRTQSGYAYVANEYGDSISTIDLSITPMRLLQTTSVAAHGDHPVGMAIDSAHGLLYVAAEGAVGAGTSKSGAVLIYDISTPATPQYVGRRNGGCVPARLKVGNDHHLWVAARESDAVFVFDTDILAQTFEPSGGLVSYVITGHQPLDMAFAHGGAWLLVANSNRSTTDVGSMVAFNIHAVLTNPASVAPVAWYSSGGGFFSRQIAVHNADVYMTNFASNNLRHYNIP